MARIKPYGDASGVEKELNDQYKSNLRIKPEDIQVYAMIDKYNYLPVYTSIDSKGNFHIEDRTEIIGRPLFVGTRKQFLYKRYERESIGVRYNGLKFLLDETFKTAWDPKKYIIFKDGHLLSPSMYSIYIPSFDNDYSEKCIYFPYRIDPSKNRLDIFYIEHDDFINMRFNQDAFITTKKAFCENKGQTLVKVPYPNDFYPRSKQMFFVLDGKKGTYLDSRYDYITADGAEYIVLKEDTHLVKPYDDYLTFVFPYVSEEFDVGEDNEDAVGEASGISFLTYHSSYDPKKGSYYNPNGIVKFTEEDAFDKYDLTANNIMLFCNNTFMEPDRYKILNNNTIKLLRLKDVEHYEFARFVLLVFAAKSERTNVFDLIVKQTKVRTSDNGIFKIPQLEPISTNFMVFYDSLFFDISDRFVIDRSVTPNVIRLNSPLDDLRIKDGNTLTFVFYIKNKDSYSKSNKTIEICKVNFISSDDGTANMQADDLEYDIQFNDKNCVIFLNGTYLDPKRYEIEDNVLKFKDKFDILRKDKLLTAIYLVSHPTFQESTKQGYYIHDGLNETYNDKRLVLDELYSKPKIELDPNFVYTDPPKPIVGGAPWTP